VTAFVELVENSEAIEYNISGKKFKNIPLIIEETDVFANREQFDKLLTFCRSSLGRENCCNVLLAIADLLIEHGEMGRAEEILDVVLSQPDLCDGQEHFARAFMRRGEVFSRLGRWESAENDLRRSRRIFTTLKNDQCLGQVENISGTNHAERGNMKKARSAFMLALASFKRVGDVRFEGIALMNIGIIDNIRGEYDSALAEYNRAKSCFEQVGDMRRLAELHHNIGMTFFFKGSSNVALSSFEECFLLASRGRNPGLMGLASLGKAQTLYGIQDFPMAIRMITQSMEYFTRCKDRLGLADCYKIKGMIHRKISKIEIAETYLQTSLRINLELNNNLNAGETLAELAELEILKGDRKSAARYRAEAVACFRKVGARKQLERFGKSHTTWESAK